MTGETLAGIRDSLTEAANNKDAIIKAYQASQQALKGLPGAIFQQMADMGLKYATIGAQLKAAYEAWEKEPENPEKAGELEVLKKISAYVEPLGVYTTDAIKFEEDMVASTKAMYEASAKIFNDVHSA